MTKQISGEEHAAMTSTVAKRKSNSFPGTLVVVGAGIVLLLGIGFFGGIEYQKNQSPAGNKMVATSNQSNGEQGFQMGPGGQGGRMNLRGGIGEVTAINGTSISVKNSFNDTTNTYEITDDTQITENGENIEKDSIKVGDRVIVQASSSNSKQASRIIVNPSMPGNGQGPGGQTQTSSPDIQAN